MKHWSVSIFFFILLLSDTTTSFSQVAVWFDPYHSGPVVVPAGSRVVLHTTAFVYIQPRGDVMSAYFKIEGGGPNVEVNPQSFGGSNWGTWSTNITITIKSDTPQCYSYSGITAVETNSSNIGCYYSFGPIVFYDTNVIGHAAAFAYDSLHVAGSLQFGTAPVGDSTWSRFHITLDSPLARYRKFIPIGFDTPFFLKDTISLDYGCMVDNPIRILFKPESTGFFIDTAYLLDPLQHDSIPLILLGEGIAAGVSDNQPVANLRIFPNPADHEANISLTNGGIGIVTIYNMMGDGVMHVPLNGEDYLSLNTSALPTGLYYVEALTQEKVYRERLVVSH